MESLRRASVALALCLTVGLGFMLVANTSAAAQAGANDACSAGVEAGMQEVLALPIAAESLFTAAPDYALDDRNVLNGSVGRVTYCLQLGADWVSASFDAPHSDPDLLGVPVTEAATARDRVAVTVHSNVAGVAVGQDLAGAIEFYPNTYAQARSLGTPGTSSAVFDADDTITGGRYGAMQVHVTDAEAGTSSTVFAWNGWARSGEDDRGIGAPAGGHPDWTFAGTGADQVATLRVFASSAVGTITDPGAMHTGAIVPRKPGADLGQTKITGVAPGAARVRARSFLDGVRVESRIRTVNADGTFEVRLAVPAQTRSHTAVLDVHVNGRWRRLRSAADIAGGDVYLIQGQSNAVAQVFGADRNGLEGLASPWIRSYGSSSQNYNPDATAWTTAVAAEHYTFGAIGQWGMQLGADLLAANDVPVAIFNGADGGKPAIFFQRDANDAENSSTNYGRFLRRLRGAGVDQSALAIGWYQGEADIAIPEEHGVLVSALFDSWQQDLPSLSTIHMIQVHTGCRAGNFPELDLAQRNVQREIALERNEVALISTAALPDHDGCHYLPTGYAQLGSQVALLMQRDVLGNPAPAGIDSPVAVSATFTNPARTAVRVQFGPSTDQIIANNTIDFGVNDPDVDVTAVSGGAGYVDLALSGPPVAGSTLRFLGALAPFPVTEWGAGLAAFDGLAITGDFVTGCEAFAQQLMWEAEDGVAKYQVRRNGTWVGSSEANNFSIETAGDTFVIRHRQNGSLVNRLCVNDTVATLACSIVGNNISWDAFDGVSSHQIRRDGAWLAGTTNTRFTTNTAGHEFAIRYRFDGATFDVACTR